MSSWSDYSELRKFTEKKENIEKFINGKLGSNIIFKYKSRSLTKDLINIGQIAEKSTLDIITKNKIQIKEIEIFIKDLINYKKCQIEDIFSLDKQKISNFKFDIPKFIKDNKDMFNISNLDNYKFNKIKKLEFLLSDDQIDQIKSYNSLFGTKIDGISRPFQRLYKKAI